MSKNPPIRPGLIIKEALEHGPLGISEIHRIYRDKVKGLNALRSKQDRIHAATYWSFARQCQFARALGLIEKDREEPLEYPPDGEALLTIRDGKVVPSRHVIYRLTARGSTDNDAWLNLGAAVRERLGGARKVDRLEFMEKRGFEILKQIQVILNQHTYHYQMLPALRECFSDSCYEPIIHFSIPRHRSPIGRIVGGHIDFALLKNNKPFLLLEIDTWQINPNSIRKLELIDAPIHAIYTRQWPKQNLPVICIRPGEIICPARKDSIQYSQA